MFSFVCVFIQVIAADEYYKKCVSEPAGSQASWNSRDQHMTTTLLRIQAHLEDPKIIGLSHCVSRTVSLTLCLSHCLCLTLSLSHCPAHTGCLCVTLTVSVSLSLSH